MGPIEEKGPGTRPEISTYSRDIQCLSSPPPLFSLLFFFSASSLSLSLFLPSVVRAPCSSRSRPLPRGPIQPLLLCSYYQAHGSRPNRKLGIYALFQIDLLYLILIRPVAHSYSNSPSRGSTLLREPFFF